MKNILFYISGHGFGHSTRMAELVKKLYSSDSKLSFHIRTSAPDWLFKTDISIQFDYSYFVCDTGIVQKDGISPNRLETLKEYANFIGQKKEFFPQEVEFVKRNSIRVIVADIPSLAFEIAARVGIPSFAISNFSWDWIYSPYVGEYPEYKYLLEEIREGYSKATKLLRLPFSPDMSVFTVIEDIPLIARKSNIPKEEILDRLGISKTERRKIVLLSFGGIGYPDNFLANVESCEDYLFISCGKPVQHSYRNLISVARDSSVFHPDLVNASDLVVTKLGYGIVSECLANRTPIMYTSRDSPEHALLEEGVKKYAHSHFIAREDLLQGNWKVHLDSFFKTQYEWPEIRLDGAEVASKKILNELIRA